MKFEFPLKMENMKRSCYFTYVLRLNKRGVRTLNFTLTKLWFNRFVKRINLRCLIYFSCFIYLRCFSCFDCISTAPCPSLETYLSCFTLFLNLSLTYFCDKIFFLSKLRHCEKFTMHVKIRERERD